MIDNEESLETRLAEINPTPIGKLSAELASKDMGKIDIEEQGQELTKGYMDYVLETVASGKKLYPNDFFVVVITKQEKLMSNVIRNYFLHRMSCPPPEYNQAVFMYNKKDDSIDFLWVLPNKKTCKNFTKHKELVPPEQWSLLEYILKFRDFTLLRLSDQLNKERYG